MGVLRHARERNKTRGYAFGTRTTGNDQRFVDGRVLREIDSLRIVASNDGFDLKAFSARNVRFGALEAPVSAVVGTTDASDPAPGFTSASASGAKNDSTLVWSMARNAEGSRSPRNLAISISRSCSERRFRLLY